MHGLKSQTLTAGSSNKATFIDAIIILSDGLTKPLAWLLHTPDDIAIASQDLVDWTNVFWRETYSMSLY